jgi:hypothetical protein
MTTYIQQQERRLGKCWGCGGGQWRLWRRSTSALISSSCSLPVFALVLVLYVWVNYLLPPSPPIIPHMWNSYCLSVLVLRRWPTDRFTVVHACCEREHHLSCLMRGELDLFWLPMNKQKINFCDMFSYSKRKKLKRLYGYSWSFCFLLLRLRRSYEY